MKFNSGNKKYTNLYDVILTDQISSENIDKMFNNKKEEDKYDIDIEKREIIKNQYNRAINYMKNKNKKKYLKKNEITIEYVIKKNENKIRLFGSNFFKKNKDLCKLKINGEKEEDLIEFIEIDNFSKKKEIFILKFIWNNDLTDLSYMFADCTNLINILNIENLIDVEITNISNLFRNCTSLIITPNLSECNTDYVENMSSLFRGCKNLKKISGISNWDTSKVTKMTSLFYNCENLEKCPDISKWNTSKVTNFSGMFYNCGKLTELSNISNWNTKNVINMSLMFYGCESLNKLPDISKWETTKLKSIKALFYGCKNLIELPNISKWTSDNINDISAMFYNCESITTLPNIFDWKLKNFTDISNLFYNCKNLSLNPIFSSWDFSKVTDMSGMFYGCTKLEEIDDSFSDINTNNVTNLSFLFYNCIELKKLPKISNWDTRSLKNMQGMFYNCKSLTELPDISYWDTCELKDISYLFYGCESLNYIPDISKWNISEVKNTSFLFYNCKSLKKIPDITKWNINKIIDMKEMFYTYSPIKEVENISNSIVKYSNIFDKIFKTENNKKELIPNLVKENNINEKIILDEIQNLYDYGKRRICQININNIHGSGFFLEIQNNLNLDIPFKRALFTNYHVISEKLVIDESNININFLGENKKSISINLKLEEIDLFSLQNYNNENNLNLTRKIFTDKFLDYTCIEILDNDNIINYISFFHNNINQLKNKNYKEDNENIFILYLSSQQEASFSLGKIIQIDNPLIYYTASTSQGSSGSPIFKRDNFGVIGIHKREIQNNINITNNIDNILFDINNKVKYISSIKDMINYLIKEKFINQNKKFEYSNIKLLKEGKIGNIYQGIIKENKNLVLIIIINLFQLNKNNNLLDTLKMIIKNIELINNNSIYDIYIEGNGINFVIKRAKLNFEEYFSKKNKKLDFEEIKYFLIQLNNYLKIFRNLNINLDYISYQNILVEEESNNIKYQFLFYYNKIITGKFLPILSAPELKLEEDHSKCDLWSIGVLLYYITMNGEYPFITKENYSEKIKNDILINNLKNNYLSDLIIKLLKYKKEERIEWDDYFNYNINNNNK